MIRVPYSQQKKKNFAILPSLPPVTPFKGRCTGRLSHGRENDCPSRLPPVRAPLPSPDYCLQKLGEKDAKKGLFWAGKFGEHRFFLYLCKAFERCTENDGLESWITYEKHHEKPAYNEFNNHLKLKAIYGRKILSGSWDALKCPDRECAYHRAVPDRQLLVSTQCVEWKGGV